MIRYSQEETFDKILDWFKRSWKIILIVLVIGLPIFAWSQVTMIHETSTPEFCNTCHSMHKEFQTWKKSQHHNVGLECGSCHNGGPFLSPRYLLDKVVAMRSVLHELMDVAVEDHPSKAKRMGIKLWPQNLREDRNGITYFVDIPKDSFAWNVILRNCERCHLRNAPYDNEKEELEKHDVEPPQMADFTRKNGHSLYVPHAFHRRKGVACMECHTEVVHGPNPPLNLPRMPLCFQCHNGVKAHQDCRKCHVGEKDIWAGEGGYDVEKSEAYMLGEVDCIECHGNPQDPDEAGIFPVIGGILKRCIECHDDPDRKEIKADWHSQWSDKVKEIEPFYQQIKSKVKHKGEGSANKEIFKLFEEGEHNYLLAKLCSGRGVHNIEYAMALFQSAKEKLEKVNNML